MKLSLEKPEIYPEVKKHFPYASWEYGLIIAYGDTIYCKYPLGDDKLIHEATHLKQQEKDGPRVWWDKYFEDREFRFQQEVEAYRMEVRFIKENIKDRNRQARMIHAICGALSSNLYGKLCTYSEAKKLLK